MARDDDKAKKITAIAAEYGGRVAGVGKGDTLIVTIPADRDTEFRAHLASEKLKGYRVDQRADAIDINWYEVDAS
jgi:hypothetical protein